MSRVFKSAVNVSPLIKVSLLFFFYDHKAYLLLYIIILFLFLPFFTVKNSSAFIISWSKYFFKLFWLEICRVGEL